MLGIDIEHRHVHQSQVHLIITNGDAAVDESVALVELLDELAEGLAGLVG